MTSKSQLETVSDFIPSIERLKKFLRRGKSRQVDSKEEKTASKALAFAWFNTVKPNIGVNQDDAILSSINKCFGDLAEYSAKSVLRTKYIDILKKAKTNLISLQSTMLLIDNQAPHNNNSPPDFSPLIRNEKMRIILNRRWNETRTCMNYGAPLAATIMMGALLEALLLARINKMDDKTPLFRLGTCPKDKTGKPHPLQKWTLNDYINAAHEIGWIGKPAKDVGVIMRDYRNFVHPAKEFSEGIVLQDTDTALFWAIFVQLVDQIIASATQ